MFSFLRRYLPYAALSLLCMMGEALIDLAQPKLMEGVINEGVLAGAQGLPHLYQAGGQMLLLALGGAALGILGGVFSNLCAQNFGNDLRKDVFRRALSLDLEQADRITAGSLVTRITNDVTQVQSMISAAIRGVIRSGMFLVAGTLALLSLDLRFGQVAFVAMLLICLGIALIVTRTRPLFPLQQQRIDALNTTLAEDIDGARVIKGYAQEEQASARFTAANDQLADTQLKLMLLIAMLPPFANVVLSLAIVAILQVGGQEAQLEEVAPGTIMAATTYMTQILIGLLMLAMIFQIFIRGFASHARLREVITLTPSIRDGSYPEGAPKGRGSLALQQVSFTYPGAKGPALSDITLALQPGETLAIVGATGSGKSTLAALLLRLYDVTEGCILLDGVDIRDYPLGELRSRIAIALQKPELFQTTLRENIRMGRMEATEEEIEEAARIAQAQDFILSQPAGYDTQVAEGGTSLSGGQKQRIALARALLRRSELLILDDSTSALDMKTETAFYQALRARDARPTCILIAQRIATARRADCIAVLDGGRLVACGTHEELLASSPVYQNICASQLSGTGKKAPALERKEATPHG